MTLVVLPDGGQQPSSSGHQCRTAGMANAGSSSKPEMYSRGVQTGFPHPSGNADLQHLDSLPICICGQAAEGNCWCEGLGFLKELKACKLVLQQKGCRRSRVAILRSIHEEFCRSARGDMIINTQRRGSAHGDIRVRRLKAAPPPTLPRPRAQSMIVRNSRAANCMNEANIHRRPQVAVKPKVHVDHVQQERLGEKGKCNAKTQLLRDEQKTSKEKCLSEIKAKQCNAPKQECSLKQEDDDHLDQNSCVSKAWLLFTGCEKVKKSENTKVKHAESQKRLDETVESGASNACLTQRLPEQTNHLKEHSVPHWNRSIDKVNRITELSISSVTNHKIQVQSTVLPTGRSNKNAVCLPGKTEVTTNHESKAVDCKLNKDRCADMLFPDSEKPPSVIVDESAHDRCFSCTLKDSVPCVDLSVSLSSPLAEEDNLISTIKSATKQSQNNAELPSDLKTCKGPNEKLDDSENLEDCLAISASRDGRFSCRDSGIGDDVSVSELKLIGTPTVIVEDQSESALCLPEGETGSYHSQGSSLPVEGVECNISSRGLSNSQMPDSVVSETVNERLLLDSVLQREDDSVLGACAIFRSSDDSCACSNPCLSSSELESTVHPMDTRLSAHKPTEGDIPSVIVEDVDAGSRTLIEDTDKPCYVSSAFLIQKCDSRFKSEHCLYLSDGELSQDKASKQVYLSGTKIQMIPDRKFVSKLDVDLPNEQCEHEEELKEEEFVKEKICEKSKNRRSRELKSPRALDRQKLGSLRYLICQSPLVLCEPNESDYEDSDSESDEPSFYNLDIFAVMPVHIVCAIFKELKTRDLASLKCACKNFEWLIENYDIKGVDSQWVETKSYRNDPCMQCGKIRDPRGDVSLCRWHPKIYYRNGHIGRRYWTCCLNPEEDAQGCQIGLHDNNWTTSKVTRRSIPKPWRSHRWHLCSLSDICWPDPDL